MIKALVPAAWEFMDTHLCFPMRTSTTLDVPPSDNGDVAIPFVLKDLPDPVTYIL